MIHRLLAGLGLALVLAFAPLASADAQAEFGQAKLESFVSAAIAVNDLIEQWGPRIEEAESEEQAAQLREQANAEMVTAIDQTEGISVDEYQTIVQAARNDPELSGQLQQMFEEQAAE